MFQGVYFPENNFYCHCPTPLWKFIQFREIYTPGMFNFVKNTPQGCSISWNIHPWGVQFREIYTPGVFNFVNYTPLGCSISWNIHPWDVQFREIYTPGMFNFVKYTPLGCSVSWKNQYFNKWPRLDLARFLLPSTGLHKLNSLVYILLGHLGFLWPLVGWSWPPVHDCPLNLFSKASHIWTNLNKLKNINCSKIYKIYQTHSTGWKQKGL